MLLYSRGQRTCQFDYYGPMGLEAITGNYRQVGRDELCTCGPNLELGGALVPPKTNKVGRRGEWGGNVRNSADHGPIVLVICLGICLGYRRNIPNFF